MSVGSSTMGDELFFQRETGMKNPMHIHDYNIWRKGCTWNLHVLPPNKVTWKSIGLCNPLSRWKELNSWLPPQILKPKCAYYNGLATLQSGVREMSHISNYVYVENDYVYACHFNIGFFA